MKHVISVIVTLILAISLFAGCSNDNQISNTTPSTRTSTEPSTNTEATKEVNIDAFPEVDTSWENLDVYRDEVQARLAREEYFTAEEEAVLVELMLSRSGFGRKHVVVHTACIVEFNELYSSVNTLYFPVIFREGSSLVLWYTTESGSVLLEGIYGYWNDSNYVGHLHTDDSNEVVIESFHDYRMTWNGETSQVTIWQFGNTITTYTVPESSVYCGFSKFEGHIFRQGADVYSLDLGTQVSSGNIRRIATGVVQVLTADYSYASDPWSQPLFLMEDGTIKCYISWEGDQDAPADDPSHLVDLRRDGEYQ